MLNNENKSRVAIQLFGHMRTFELCYKSLLENLILPQNSEKFEVDIFIHTWDELNHSTVNWRNQNGIKIETASVDKKMIEKIKKIYKPKRIAVQKQRQIEEKIIIEKIAKNEAFNKRLS